MNKSIKDFLHLYLGCEMYNADIAKKLNGLGIKYILQKLKTVGSDGLFWVGSEEDSRPIEDTKYKPVLRPLSDMTEEEKKEWEDIALTPKGYAKRTVIIEAETTYYLLSKHFDLFGLIESGLAIDKTKINQPAQ